MTSYLILVLDVLGQVEGELELDFDTDDQAVATVFGADTMFGCELWCGTRLLGLFDPLRSLGPIAVYGGD